MARGVKTGGRQKGTANKATKDLRSLLKDLLVKEVNSIEKHLAMVDPKDRLDILVKLLPYVIPKYSETSSDLSPKENGTNSFFTEINNRLKDKGFGSACS